jgi:hypothetical protein
VVNAVLSVDSADSWVGVARLVERSVKKEKHARDDLRCMFMCGILKQIDILLPLI